MLVRSGSEPPVLCAAGSTDGFNSWSGDGKILKNKDELVKLSSLSELFEFSAAFCCFYSTMLWRNIKLHLLLAILVARHPSNRHFQTALIFLKDQKGVALHQSRGVETSASVSKRKRSCERRSENLCDLTGKRAPRIRIVINVLHVTTISYLIPGTSHVLDVDESSYNEKVFMSCSSEAVYMYSKCKALP